MPRPPRPQYAGAIYHVTLRGVVRRAIFIDDYDRVVFLALLAEAVDRFVWELYAYCLMTNHFHLLFCTPQPNLARGMQWINSCYAQWFNRRYGSSGHVFERRYGAVLVETDAHALELCRYIALNPVGAGLAAQPSDYQWSSYRATVGIGEAEPFVRTEWLTSLFGRSLEAARERLRAFVETGTGLVGGWEPVGSDPHALS